MKAVAGAIKIIEQVHMPGLAGSSHWGFIRYQMGTFL
jgi:hypothetical protein